MGFSTWLADWRKPSDLPDKDFVPETELDREYVREGLAHAISMVGTATQAINSHIQTLHIWMLASLLTLNGGAALALLSSDKLEPAQIAVSIVAYAIGCVLAVGTGLVTSLGSAPILRLTGEALDHLIYDAKSVQLREETKSAVDRVQRLGRRVGAIAGIVGALSLLAFCAGTAAMACNVL